MDNIKKITLDLPGKSYNVYIGSGIINSLNLYLEELKIGNFALVVTCAKIFKIYKKTLNNVFKNLPHKILLVADGEAVKSPQWLLKIAQNLLNCDTIDKQVYIVNFGGGTIGDLGGFLASIYKRGIPYIQVPTTFLSQIDASIGGKTAIDLKQAKNVLGTIYQPKAVFIDPNFLYSLKPKELKQGFAEMIKYALIKDESLLDFLYTHYQDIIKLDKQSIEKIIYTCVTIKAKVVMADETEKKGIRTILNFGHTFAHALETALNYRKISHGQAVSVGMVYAAYLSYYLKKCPQDLVAQIQNILKLFGLPIKISFDYNLVNQAFMHDKKFTSGNVRMVLIKKPGKTEVIVNIDKKYLKKAALKVLS